MHWPVSLREASTHTIPFRDDDATVMLAHRR
jgi:hypothetical protein